MSAEQKPRALPRRATTIRTLAASMARKKLGETNARQAVSDRIGYAAAALVGGVAFRFGGPWGVVAIVVLYGLSAVLAHRRHVKLRDLR